MSPSGENPSPLGEDFSLKFVAISRYVADEVIMEYNILQLGMMRKPLVAFRRQPTFRLKAKVVEFLLRHSV
jgi:hypothetical protein